MTHTPGPWTCHSGAVWKDGPNVYPKGNEIGIPIATMDREPGNGTLPVERDDNARLIAAAPETAAERDKLKAINAELVTLLREALPHVEKMADVLATGPVAGPIEHLANDISAAIAKAQSA